MTKETPDHHDAEIVLKLYELRREEVMRQSRLSMIKFLPRNWEEFFTVTQPQHPNNPAWRQVSSYFEMAYGMARHGIVHADFLAENTGEGLLLYTKILPYLPRFRADVAPLAFRNAEWLVENSASAKRTHELFKTRVAKMLEGG